MGCTSFLTTVMFENFTGTNARVSLSIFIRSWTLCWRHLPKVYQIWQRKWRNAAFYYKEKHNWQSLGIKCLKFKVQTIVSAAHFCCQNFFRKINSNLQPCLAVPYWDLNLAPSSFLHVHVTFFHIADTLHLWSSVLHLPSIKTSKISSKVYRKQVKYHLRSMENK